MVCVVFITAPPVFLPSPMKIEFVNHSSFVIDTHGIRLICDPWLDGTVFNQGWALLAETQFKYEDFRNITHIWFSHEHPDHFFPPNLKKIAPEERARITVLFQQTRDGQVAALCRKLGFKEVVELPFHDWTEIAPGLEILCRAQAADWGECDSWLCVRSEECTLLNINDCEVNSTRVAENISKLVGPVDVLSTQYSYANFEGNAENVEERQRGAANKLGYAITQTRAIKPKFVIPFASFVWFCHEENFYMNDSANRIGDVADAIRAKTDAEPIVLYPGDAWTVGEEHDSTNAISRWNREYEDLDSRPLLSSAEVSPEELLEAGRIYFKKRREKVSSFISHVHSAAVVHPLRGIRDRQERNFLNNLSSFLLLQAKPAYLWITDHEAAYELTGSGLRTIDLTEEQTDVSLSAESLLFCFKFPWGCETLQINGRFHLQYPRAQSSLAGHFKLDRLLHHGHSSLLREAAHHVLKRNKDHLLDRLRG